MIFLPVLYKINKNKVLHVHCKLEFLARPKPIVSSRKIIHQLQLELEPQSSYQLQEEFLVMAGEEMLGWLGKSACHGSSMMSEP